MDFAQFGGEGRSFGLGRWVVSPNFYLKVWPFRSVPGRFARESFRPWVVSPVGRFALGRFALSRFAPESFRPFLVGRFALIFF